MATTLANIGEILKSLSSPRRSTIIGPTESDSAHADGSDSGEDITLAQKKAPSGKTGTSGPGSRSKGSAIDALASRQLVISPAFKLVVILVFSLIILLAGAAVLIALFGNPNNPTLTSTANVLSTAFTASVGAILGLIGGKAVT